MLQSRQWILKEVLKGRGPEKRSAACLSRRFHSGPTGPTTSVSIRNKSSLAANDVDSSSSTTPKIPLKHIPALPVLGSMIPAYSGISFDQNKMLDNWADYRKKFGDFYTIGIPGLGVGTYGTLYIVQDPNEMAKVLRSEGKYPTSSVQDLWPFRQMQDDYGMGTGGKLGGGGILDWGEPWKRIRNFMQTDLLAPKAANRYLPGILKSTKYCSAGLPHHKEDLNYFLQLSSFDMFCSVLFGAFPRMTDPSNTPDPADVEFCKNVAKVVAGGSTMPLSVWQTLLHKMGIRSSAYKELYADWLKAINHGQKIIAELEEKKEKGLLTEAEESSYWNQAMERWKLGETDLTIDEVRTICLTMFNASVDTTSAKTAWHFLHMGLNDEVQEKLYQELYTNVQETEGVITPGLFAASKSPYLGAVLRESNRITCPANLSPIRKIVSDIEIHGHIIPKGSKVAFDQVAKSLDPQFVDEPHEFRPERFLPDAVEARKGTKSEFLDHAFFSSPFGQGARRCPGSRVARNESMALLAQCVLDWKMSIPSVSDYRDVPAGLDTLYTPKLPAFEFEARKA